jgi:hypothetical protein
VIVCLLHNVFNLQCHMRSIFYSLAVLFLVSCKLSAQSLPSPCRAVCLDPSNSSTLQTPVKARPIPSCNMTPADTSVWWVFRPSGTSFNFSFSTSGCVCNTGGGVFGAAITVYAGECDNLTKLQCKQGISGSFGLTGLTPCKLYWIQAGSTNTCQCNVKITYNVNQILRTIQPIAINGPKAICKSNTETVATYTATGTTPCASDIVFRWSTAQGTAFVHTNPDGSAEFLFKNAGKYRICAENGYALCNPGFTKTCYDVEVIDLKDPTENLKICPELLPYTLELAPIIKKANPSFNKEITPSSYLIKDAPGTKKTIPIQYTITGANCAENINLNLEVLRKNKVTLPSELLIEGEQRNIKGQNFSCADAKATPISFDIDNASDGKSCDSNYVVSLQCMKVKAQITPQANLLDCLNKSVTLDAARSVTLPVAFPTGVNSTGTRSYLWNNGATSSKITVAQGGTYTVTVSYTYRWKSPTGFITRTYQHATSALVLGSINGKPITPLPNSNKTTPCDIDSVLYYQPTIKGVTYQWNVTNGQILGKQTGDSIIVAWSGNSPKRVCVRLEANCGSGNDTCMTVITSPNLPKVPHLKFVQNVGANKIRYIVTAQKNIRHIWKVKNGTLSSSIGDSIIVTWLSSQDRGLCVQAINDCSFGADTCFVGNVLKPAIHTDFSISDINNGLDKFVLSVVPNPATDQIIINTNQSLETVQILDYLGRLILQTADTTINIRQLDAGVYFLKAMNSRKEEKIIRFVKS